MKVSTDACLFGAVIPLEESGSILDIGAGTGLLSLMAAQRSHAQITAVELDSETAGQAQTNFAKSPWQHRIKLHQQSIQDFAKSTQEKFDTIICNPPFFTNHSPSEDPRRHQARHNDTLSFEDLGKAVSKLLTSDGQFQVLIPSSEHCRLIEAMKKEGLALARQVSVKPTTKKPVSREILSFSKQAESFSEREICIHTKDGYSAEFVKLLQPFYLKL
ncbi:methyltransferase [Sansalvadorimonas sp. 2012CJ34-2]|uniref:tRNA1(Val) (adenine(37)-N6)-methyltransferase n=2 Tax=Parendozoicomonas callyspongiae TaxID=2942213 RepID=A0ABT0PKH1_9GAMM|nr:methyltransferase [Sansalvadorimonas sp. 2012CJ34-2]